MSKVIYLIGSLRNPRVPAIAEELRAMGHEVFDDWFGAGHEADDEWQKYEDGRKRSFRDALAGWAAQHVFNFDLTHITRADCVMLVLPAGKSGHLEAGFARGLGKGLVILMEGEPERFDVMYNFAHLVTTDLNEASGFVHDWRAPKTDGAARVIDQLQSDLNAQRLANETYRNALAQVCHHNAQGSADAMNMREIAKRVIYPELTTKG